MSFQDPRTEQLQQLFMRLLGDVSGPGGVQQDAWQNSLYEQDMRSRMAPTQDLMFRYPMPGAEQFRRGLESFGQPTPMQDQFQGSPMQDLVRQFQQDPPNARQQQVLGSFADRLGAAAAPPPVNTGAPGADLALANASAPKPKKKGKRSEFFALLRKMDAEEAEGKNDTSKAMKALLKQMNAEGSVSPT